MSKLVMVCVRNGHDMRPKLATFLESLCPDNLSPEYVVTDDGLVVVETSSRVEPELPLALVTTRRYGSARITVFSK